MAPKGSVSSFAAAGYWLLGVFAISLDALLLARRSHSSNQPTNRPIDQSPNIKTILPTFQNYANRANDSAATMPTVEMA
jgi:hypothetical protein